MGNLGRYACVALPFALSLAAFVAMLVAGLAGVTDKSLYMFRVNTTDLSVSSSQVSSILTKRMPTPQATSSNGATDSLSSGNNVTAADLGVYDLYDISLWGYCYTPQNGSRDCTKAKFNWAEGTLNTTKNTVTSLITSTGLNVTLDDQVSDAIDIFSAVTKWTQVVFIVAYIALGIELLVGLFAACSRAFSCLNVLVAAFAAVAACAAAALATAMSVVVVGTLEGLVNQYGVESSFNFRFLVAVWIGAAFALAAGFFWLFTCCCCKPERRAKGGFRNRDSVVSSEKLIATPYRPIHSPHESYSAPAMGDYAQQTGQTPQKYVQQPYGQQQLSGVAYEPYSHTRV